jgi:23S rRNA (pseudouridine1915-N3)-methyltransferase
VRITVLAVGKVKPPFADDEAHFLKMLSGHARVEVVEVADEERLPKRVPERAFVCLLDERGRQLDSVAFSGWLEERRQAGRDVCFVIGGPFGVDLERTDETLSLGKMTLPYQLARVVLLEQLFRAHKILAREPYHH